MWLWSHTCVASRHVSHPPSILTTNKDNLDSTSGKSGCCMWFPINLLTNSNIDLCSGVKRHRATHRLHTLPWWGPHLGLGPLWRGLMSWPLGRKPLLTYSYSPPTNKPNNLEAACWMRCDQLAGCFVGKHSEHGHHYSEGRCDEVWLERCFKKMLFCCCVL